MMIFVKENFIRKTQIALKAARRLFKYSCMDNSPTGQVQGKEVQVKANYDGYPLASTLVSNNAALAYSLISELLFLKIG